MSEPAAAPPFDETLYQQSLDELRSPRPIRVTSAVFTVLMLVFVAGLFMNLKSVTGVVMLVAAVAFHEAGHALGMRVFGFRDVQMFFIPFFGAAVSGRERGAAAWKEAVVSLLGPMPGLLIGLALLFFALGQRYPTALHFQLVGALLWLNAFNLLPLGFLDGGAFLERVLFSRHRVLEIAFRGIGYLLLGYLAIQGAMVVLGLFIVLSLFALPLRWRILSAAARLRHQHPMLEPDPDRLGEPERQALFTAARTALRAPASETPSEVGRAMESILGAAKRAPGVLATAGLLLAYGVGLAVAAIGIVLLTIPVGPVEWQTVAGPGWRAEFPRPPHELAMDAGPGGARGTRWQAIVDGTERFTIEVAPGGSDGQWMSAAAEELSRSTRLTLTGTRPVELGGHPGAEFEFSVPRRVMRARMVAVGARRYEVTASAPRWGEDQERFLQSFALTDSTAGS